MDATRGAVRNLRDPRARGSRRARGRTAGRRHVVPRRRHLPGPDAVKALLELYRVERKPEETFDVFVDRTGPERLRSVLAPWTELPPSSETPEKYLDWGSDEKFKLETGTGECAA